MEKLKNVSRFRRISMGESQSDFETEQPSKKPFHRLTVSPPPVMLTVWMDSQSLPRAFSAALGIESLRPQSL